MRSKVQNCILDGVFYGDKVAQYLVMAIWKCNNGHVFTEDPFRRLRGEVLFEFFMEYYSDYDWITYKRSGTEDYTTPGPYSRAGLFKTHFFKAMVDSIGNYPASQYHNYVAEITGYYKWQLPPISAEADSIHYVHIRDAWERGLIKLKPYGKE